jgi:hypothetical protein
MAKKHIVGPTELKIGFLATAIPANGNNHYLVADLTKDKEDTKKLEILQTEGGFVVNYIPPVNIELDGNLKALSELPVDMHGLVKEYLRFWVQICNYNLGASSLGLTSNNGGPSRQPILTIDDTVDIIKPGLVTNIRDVIVYCKKHGIPYSVNSKLH